MTSADPGAAGTRAGWAASALPHVALLAVALVGVLLLSERRSGFTVDEGSYAIQAEALHGGGWEIDWPFRAVDPAGDHFPYHGGRVTDDAEYAYVSHPAWPALLSLTRRVGSETVGLRAIPLASVVVAALSAWGIASRLGARAAAPWAFWVVAASPLLPNGLMLWAHAPAAALAGLTVLAALRIVGRGPAGWWAAFPAGLAGVVLLRSEGLLFAAAAVAVVGGAALWRREPRLAALGGLGAVTTATTVVLEGWWIRAITGGGGRDLTSRAEGGGWLAGRAEGASRSLLQAASTPDAALFGLLALALVTATLILRRRRPELLAGLFAAAAALTVLRLVVAPDDPVPGLLAAWPLGVLGLAELARPDARLRLLGAGAGLFALAVVATQYDDGGGLQWGGRYFALLIVPVGALVGLGVARRSRPERVAVVGLLAATAVLGLVVTDQVRSGNAEAMEAVAALDQEAGLVGGAQLARLDWRGWPERCWLAAADRPAAAVGLLRRAGALPAAYLGLRAAELEGLGEPIRPAGGLIGVLGAGPGPGRCPR